MSENYLQEEFKRLLEATVNDLNNIKNRITRAEAKVKYYDLRHMEVIKQYVEIINENIK